jgi:hypothetical protein
VEEVWTKHWAVDLFEPLIRWRIPSRFHVGFSPLPASLAMFFYISFLGIIFDA